MPRGSYKHLVGVATCCLATGPLVFSMMIIDQAVAHGSWEPVVADLREFTIPDIFLANLLIAAAAIPSVAMIAVATYGLTRIGKTSLGWSAAACVIAGYIGIVLTATVVVGDAPGLNFGDPYNVYDAVLAILICALVSALYWLVTVRRARMSG